LRSTWVKAAIKIPKNQILSQQNHHKMFEEMFCLSNLAVCNIIATDSGIIYNYYKQKISFACLFALLLV
jgi:hypothetical protein